MFSLARDNDTICAVCTAPGRGAIAVIRVSGGEAQKVVARLAPFLPEHPESHRIYYGFLADPATKEPLDEVLLSYFAEGRSFTGESTVEISCHGGPAVTDRILAVLTENGARLAQKGEFTYRAFMRGRIDLVQAEGILAMIESRNALGARVALRQVKGVLSSELSEIEESLTWVLSRLEANLDFSAEFIEFAADKEIFDRSQATAVKMREMIASYKRGRVLKDGLRVALVGAPNVGKSSLLNALAHQDRSIVSPVAGTTRDTVEIEVDWNGHRVTLIDTAGMRETDDQIEALGVERSRRAVEEADVVAYIYDGSSGSQVVAPPVDSLALEKPILQVFNKADLLQQSSPELETSTGALYVSAKTGEGLASLQARISGLIAVGGDENSAVIQNQRHFEQLQKAEESLQRGLELMNKKASPEFIIADVQEALIAVMEMLGRRFDDNILDRVFKDFCLGK